MNASYESLVALGSKCGKTGGLVYNMEASNKTIVNLIVNLQEQLKSKDANIAALLAQVATLTQTSIKMLTKTIICMTVASSGGDGGNNNGGIEIETTIR